MAKKERQKLKLLALKEMLERETYFENEAESRLLSMPEILEKLEREWGIEAERKSLYSDLQYLREYYEDISTRYGNPVGLCDTHRRSGYAVQDRVFQLSEVRLLIDAVQSSKFITEKGSRELIGKLKTLVSIPQAKSLNREVYVTNRSKSPNHGILNRVDALHRAIDTDRMVTFKYCDWNLKTGKLDIERHDGKLYRVSPWKLVWQDDNYYLIASEEGKSRHYRVDKMKSVALTRAKRRDLDIFDGVDVAEYTESLFGMFNSGAPCRVTMRCRNNIAGVIIDRFGTAKRQVQYVDEGNGWFHFTVEVVPSVQFYGWLCGLGSSIEVVGPAEVRQKMAETVAEIHSLYQE